VNSNNGFHPNQGFTTGWKNPVSRSTTANKVVWGITSTQLNLLSRILFEISLNEPKAKSKKMSSTDPDEEEAKAKAEVEAEPGSQMEEENLGKPSPRTSVLHTYYHAVLLSFMIFLLRWVSQVFQPSLV
jgi:hypothetical protein